MSATEHSSSRSSVFAPQRKRRSPSGCTSSASKAAEKEHECGGFLLGDDIENITIATEGRNATPGPSTVMLDYEEADRTVGAFGLPVVGSWHSHPGADRFSWRPDPSPADLEQWTALLDRFDRNMAVGVIASTPHRLHAWIIFRDRSGTAICKPAR